MRKAVRNKWKRVLAVVLAAAMSLTMLPVDTQAAGEGADEPQLEPIEIVENGDFSDGTSTGWKEFGGGKIEVVSMDDGYVLKVKERTSTESSAACILSGKLIKGTSYRVTGRIKYNGTKDSQKYRLVFQNGPGWQYRTGLWGKEVEVPKDEWKTFEIDKYVPADTTVEGKLYEFSTTENYFFIETLDDNKEDFYIDDISITYMGVPGQEPEKPEEPEVESLLSNGSFEIDPIDTNWKGMGKI